MHTLYTEGAGLGAWAPIPAACSCTPWRALVKAQVVGGSLPPTQDTWNEFPAPTAGDIWGSKPA